MSGLILFIVAVALLGVAIYSPVSYLKERRASQLPVHKRRNNTFRSPPFSLISLPSCTVPYRSQNESRPAGLPSFSLCLRTYDSRPAPL